MNNKNYLSNPSLDYSSMQNFAQSASILYIFQGKLHVNKQLQLHLVTYVREQVHKRHMDNLSMSIDQLRKVDLKL